MQKVRIKVQSLLDRIGGHENPFAPSNSYIRFIHNLFNMHANSVRMPNVKMVQGKTNKLVNRNIAVTITIYVSVQFH